ncbi:MAG: methionine--tRNA ligase [Candidatus Magasanikbacteria bacterium]|nr:methionine--tRNA ligase [Candidatus Magasanikbacteria bacterium]
MGRFYLTTPIYYVNDLPHIGHAYTTFVADVIARYQRLKGNDVLFITGTDENSQKNAEAAAKAGETDLQRYLDKMSARWQETWDELNISNNDFIRTTEKRHWETVRYFFDLDSKKGDIYKGEYEGLYCDDCEAFLTEKDLADGRCPFHQKAPRRIREENYFFRLTNYKEALLKQIEDNPGFIRPEKRKNEAVSYIENNLADFSISRPGLKCGLPFPLDKNQRVYVWFDALINYLTAIGFGRDEKIYQKWWPADLHLMAKDIIKFHAVYWPAMLMSAGLPLPKTIFAHGFFTINGEKMSKSLGNVVDPVELSKIYPLDAVRYFLLREIKFGEDGDFSLVHLKEHYNNDLANEFGNLVQRVLVMAEKYCGRKVPTHSDKAEGLDPLCEIDVWRDWETIFNDYRFDEVLALIWQVIGEANKFIENEKPWKLAKNNKERLLDVIYNLLETLRQIAWLLLPIMPETSEKIWTQLGLDTAKEKSKELELARVWGGLESGAKIKKGEPIFPRMI